MASAAFRESRQPETGGADMVHRLLNHSAAARARSGAARAARPLFGSVEDDVAADQSDDVARLEAELRVLKAALRAEQDAAAALRAELEDVVTYAAPVGDIRDDRDRWANLVERLLFAER